MPEGYSAKKARQGRLGFPVLMVLISSLLLIAIVWLLMEIYGEAIEPQSQVGDPANPSFEETAPRTDG